MGRGHSDIAPRVVIVGGGIAGVETALTIARGLPGARVTLLTQWPSLRVLPNLVYVPLGMSAHRLDIPLAPLADEGIELVQGLAVRIDRERRVVHHDEGQLPYDAMVLCTGTHLEHAGGHRLRTLDDALSLRAALESLDPTRKHSLVVRQLPGCTWVVPGYEFAMLLRAWLSARGMGDSTVTVVSHDSSPLLMFNVDASTVVEGAMNELGVELLRGIPAGRVEAISGDVNIDLGRLQAQRVAGFDPVGADGFYVTGTDGSTSPGHFVVGDAADVPYKAAFATSWQARRVLRALGGDVAALGTMVDGVPATHCEYQMDMVHRTLVVRIEAESHLDAMFADTRAQVYVRSTPPDKLQGTLLKEVLIGDSHDVQVSRRFRDELLHGLSAQDRAVNG